MNIVEAIILGVIQGLTEFIPVSSSGHLVLGQHLFSGASNHLFLEYINIGTLLALLIFFRHRIVEIVRDITVNREYRLARNILITSVPAGIVGFVLADVISASPFFSSVWTVVATLAVVGILMILIEKLPHARHIKSGRDLSAGKSLLVGVAQMCALIPGVSRSGATIVSGRLLGLSPEKAAEYSFLASIPIMVAVTLKLFIKPSDPAYLAAHMNELLLGNIAAFLAGMIAIGFLMKFLSRHSLAAFGWYRLALASIVLIVLLVQ